MSHETRISVTTTSISNPSKIIVSMVLGMRLLCSKKLSIMLLSSAPKITYYAFKKILIMLKIMPLILANNVSLL